MCQGYHQKRKLMIIAPQAAIDDSVDQPSRTRLVLAGFVSSAAGWATFSDTWQRALDLEPKLDYFKMNEANLLTGQFSRDRGWTEAKRDDRVVTLVRIIKEHVLIRLHASIKFSEFEKYIAAIPVPFRKSVSDNPWIYLFTKLICAMAVRSTLFGINEPCDFVFDEQDEVCDEIYQNWPDFKQIAENVSRSDFPRFLGNTPNFENDRNFKPLQAADLFANQYRYHLELNSGRIIVPPNKFLRPLLMIPHINHDSTKEELEHLREHLLKFRDGLLERYPAAELYGYSNDPRERRRLRKRTRRLTKKPSWSSSKGRRA